MRKALQSVAGVRAEIDKLSERLNFFVDIMNDYMKFLTGYS